MSSKIMLQCKSRVSNDFASLLITTAVPCPPLPLSMLQMESYGKPYVRRIYRIDLNFRGTKLSRFSRFDSHPRKFSPAKI